MITFRTAKSEDVHNIRAFITEIVTEVYGHLIDDIPTTTTEDSLLANSLLAFRDETLVGVGVTVDDLVDDIWVSPDARGDGVGTELLRRLEKQIVDRGHSVARLRVLEANRDARRFYEGLGWIAGKPYMHERLGPTMINYTKTLLA
ncbi:MAG: N-acetyltransferase family protein [Paracoccaceae bacterium]